MLCNSYSLKKNLVFTQVDFSQINLAANTTKLHSNDTIRARSNQYRDDKLIKRRNESTSNYPDKTQDTELNKKLEDLALADSTQAVLPPARDNSCQQLQPPTILHSTFPPPHNQSSPTEQNASPLYVFQPPYDQPNGNFVAYNMVQTHSVQPASNLGAFYIPPSSNCVYQCTEDTTYLPYQNTAAHFVPTTSHPPPILATLRPSTHPSPSSVPIPSPNELNRANPKEDNYAEERFPGTTTNACCKELTVPPDDNPGLPLQDEVCPFHQHMSYLSLIHI